MISQRNTLALRNGSTMSSPASDGIVRLHNGSIRHGGIVDALDETLARR
jgi:hypothetical protein